MNDEIEELELDQLLADDEIDAPQGAQWFDEACRRLQRLEDAYARREARRDGALRRATAPIDAWFRADAEPIAAKAEMIRRAIKERMREYREATGQKSYKGPNARIASRVADEWQWPKDDTSLLLALAAIDRATFVRDWMVSSINKDNVRAVAIVKDGAALIDGVELPDLVIEQDKVTVTISPPPVPGGF